MDEHVVFETSETVSKETFENTHQPFNSGIVLMVLLLSFGITKLFNFKSLTVQVLQLIIGTLWVSQNVSGLLSGVMVFAFIALKSKSFLPKLKQYFDILSNQWPKVQILAPYVWPRNQPRLQFYIFLCLIMLTLGRFVNVYVPIYHKHIVDELTKLNFCWVLILHYSILQLLDGNIIYSLKRYAWSFVSDHTEKELKMRLYSHLHSLSLRWHLGRKTGEVFSVIGNGTWGVAQLLECTLFEIVPGILDLIVAAVYFTSAFNAYFALIALITMFLHIASTYLLSKWASETRREWRKQYREANNKIMDSLLNYETVKYYGAEEYELRQYETELSNQQRVERRFMACHWLKNGTHEMIIRGGLLAGSLLCAHYIAEKTNGFSVGDYVLFASYISQLCYSLSALGYSYSRIQQSLIDMEQMLELLQEPKEVNDEPDAPSLKFKSGRIEFRDVEFAYNPEKPVLRKISFVVEPGKTVALVGPSGGGKSTVIRLLFRFYDINNGCILIDGQDISKVTQDSLRALIGVVPQDTVLFNENIRYNIGYGKKGADNAEVEEAAKAADIHVNISNLPQGFDTVVGERGLKLSGGEKQRVAIARTILKAPQFFLFDEATSALDTNTERNIQASLRKLCAGRTTLIVAHRLSTIIHADEILVLKEGVIVERGRHEQLLELEGGSYRTMWEQQLRSNHGIDTEEH